ncbi:hypothetical protein DE146DRAFT_274853 [Phaeosphaeria sp. MPI-PUGE-AT-0046c]|nr:hypothetical protein DE146DRAFT_274853 [Phaeosphaeria sp. MPI-PUGE-AT-0046c]
MTSVFFNIRSISAGPYASKSRLNDLWSRTMFEFITSSHPDDCKSEVVQKRIREHAIRKGLRAKKERCASEREKGAHVINPAGQMNKVQLCTDHSLRRPPYSVSLVDPFQSLCESPDRLAALLRHPLIYRAGKPVFRITDGSNIQFQGMELLERGILADPLLFYAVSLAATLAINHDHQSAESLRYRGLLIRELHTSVLKRPLRSKVSFAVALLVLIGSEYGTEGTDRRSLEWHLRGMHAVIAANTTSKCFPNLHILQRALFWQDLISCLTADTPRLLSHMTPFNCKRLEGSLNSARSPMECGFRASGLNCASGFWTVLKDIRNLCRIVDAYSSVDNPSVSLGSEVQLLEQLDDEGYPIDNAQANIESRVVDLLHEARQSSTSYSALYQACLYAAYLCTYKLSTGVWAGQFVPEICASRILDHVAEAIPNDALATSTNLLTWLLFMSGELTERRETRSRAVALLKQAYMGQHRGFLQTGNDVTAMLETFIWCRAAMDKSVLRMEALLLNDA